MIAKHFLKLLAHFSNWWKMTNVVSCLDVVVGYQLL